MTDDERQRLMDFILEQQAATSAKLDQLSDDHKQLLESHRRDSIRFDRDERVLKLMIGAGGRARRDLRETQQLAQQNSEDIKALIDSQLLTQHIAREQHESIKKLQETVARNSEDIRRHSEAAERHSEAAERHSEATQRYGEAIERTNQAIAELAEIVKQLATRRNGNS